VAVGVAVLVFVAVAVRVAVDVRVAVAEGMAGSSQSSEMVYSPKESTPSFPALS
jgi:hypothetical protein